MPLATWLLLLACTTDDAEICADGVTGTLSLSTYRLADGETLTATVVVAPSSAAITRVDVAGAAATAGSGRWTHDISWSELLPLRDADGRVEVTADVWPSFCDASVPLEGLFVEVEPTCEAPPSGTITVDRFEVGASESVTVVVDVDVAGADVFVDAWVSGRPVSIMEGSGTLTLTHAELTSLLGGPGDTERPLSLTLAVETDACPRADLDTLSVTVAGSGPVVGALTLATNSLLDVGWYPTTSDAGPNTFTVLTISSPDEEAVGGAVALAANAPLFTGGATEEEVTLGAAGSGAAVTTFLQSATAGTFIVTATAGNVTTSLPVTFVAPPSARATTSNLDADGVAFLLFISEGGSIAECWASYPDSFAAVYREAEADPFTNIEGLDTGNVTFTVVAANTTTEEIAVWVTCTDAYGRAETEVLTIAAAEVSEPPTDL